MSAIQQMIMGAVGRKLEILETNPFGTSNGILSTSVCFDSNSNKIVVGYRDSNDGDRGVSIVGTISGNSVTFGTPVYFNSDGLTYSIDMVFDSTNNKVIAAYRDTANAYGTVKIGTISGNTITYGSAVIFNSGPSNYITAIYESNSNKVIIGFQGLSQHGWVTAGTVSGDSISFGDIVKFSPTYTNNLGIVYTGTTDKMCIFYTDWDTQQGKGVIGTLSGNNVSIGTAYTHENADNRYIHAEYAPDIDKMILSSLVNGSIKTSVTYISGSSIIFGTKDVSSVGTVDNLATAYNINTGKFYAVFRGNSDYGYYMVGTISGNSISFGTPVIFERSVVWWIDSTYDSVSGKVIISYRDGGGYGKVAVI